ncbi:MAG: malto-oligosyltrehalose trehalohydrolase [Chloroflexota bacterium]|nr:malto-oligosyltrehalose trehalohydrolase [Chloroflexota bacterium]
MSTEPARVWAPTADSVEIETGGRRLPLQRRSGGWWQSEQALLSAGTDYAFAIDGGDAVPDPRSRWQPHGVHGASRWVDHDEFAWTDHGWQAPAIASAVFYELHVGTFSPAGTFDGVIERLPYLADLGVTHVELMPVNEFPGEHGWGYDGVDLYAPHDGYGGPEGLKRLVDAAHRAGLAVVLDVVYNHLGPDGNYLGRFGPYLTDRYVTPWGSAINLDGRGSHEVRRFLIDNALMWLRDYHFDGLRLDAVHAFVDTSAVHFLEELATAVDGFEMQSGRRVLLIAESDLNDPRVVRPRTEHGYGIDAQWSDDFHHALHVTLTSERQGYYTDFVGFADLCTALADVFVYGWRYAPSRDRFHGRPVDGMTRRRFLAYAQNHDQVGNRAAGERLSQLVGPRELRVAAALVVLGPQVPMLFAGEEWAASTPFQYFTDHTDEALGRAVTEGRTHEFEAFGWNPDVVPDPQSRTTFERSRLDWSEREGGRHAELLAWYRRLMGARRTIDELAAGTPPRVACSEAEQWLTVERNDTLLAANLAGEVRRVRLPGERYLLEIASDESVELAGDELVMPPMTAALLLGG